MSLKDLPSLKDALLTSPRRPLTLKDNFLLDIITPYTYVHIEVYKSYLS